ncbi:hypothetical protein SLEP1_g32381 [Rubroshorea leprosula]|uniref:MATH domain-containing protein n=1 Tax=Rubroshorea leprosula TaxID=152421 RepID=A0AAV5KDC1_9ROSI|nr:hypothetical protein SLEP1_g32381 [Rubroshorea leprosula]
MIAFKRNQAWNVVVNKDLVVLLKAVDDGPYCFSAASEHKFNAQESAWGFSRFIPLKELHDYWKGYLTGDTCIIETDVTVFGDVASSSKDTSIVAKEDPTQEKMNAFFVNLESGISSSKHTSSREEVEEALSMIENAYPTDLNDPGRISNIKNAFDVLSSLDDYCILTVEQKAELLTMKEKFNALHERAARAKKDKNMCTHREFVKLTLGRKLERCLTEFNKAKEETEQQERSIVTLQSQLNDLLAQIGEAQKKKDNFSSKQKEMFKLSKDLKAELDALEEQWPEYEARMKAAEAEEEKVSTEWHKIKQFVSSLKTSYSYDLKPSYM